jgi:hypothetical protein
MWNGETLYKNSVKIYDDETNLLLQILDPSQAYKTIHTFPGSSLYEQWHVIYVRFNCDTLLYEMAQYDGTRVPIQTEPFYSIANTQTPSGYTRFNVERKTGETAIIAFDNIAVSYEEL